MFFFEYSLSPQQAMQFLTLFLQVHITFVLPLASETDYWQEEFVGFEKMLKIFLMMTFFTVLLFYDTKIIFPPYPTPPTHNSTWSPDSGLLAVIASDSQIQGMLSIINSQPPLSLSLTDSPTEPILGFSHSCIRVFNSPNEWNESELFFSFNSSTLVSLPSVQIFLKGQWHKIIF